MSKRQQKGEIVHGTAWTYKDYGCRCDACTAANTLYIREKRDALEVKGKEHPELIPHGTPSGYINWRCRCDDCREASKGKPRIRPPQESPPGDFDPVRYFEDSDAFLASLDE